MSAARERENAERFAALVAHPYGLAAVELTREKFRRVRWGYEAEGELDKAEAMGRAAVSQTLLLIQLKKARSRARRRA